MSRAERLDLILGSPSPFVSLLNIYSRAGYRVTKPQRWLVWVHGLQERSRSSSKWRGALWAVHCLTIDEVSDSSSRSQVKLLHCLLSDSSKPCDTPEVRDSSGTRACRGHLLPIGHVVFTPAIHPSRKAEPSHSAHTAHREFTPLWYSRHNRGHIRVRVKKPRKTRKVSRGQFKDSVSHWISNDHLQMHISDLFIIW